MEFACSILALRKFLSPPRNQLPLTQAQVQVRLSEHRVTCRPSSAWANVSARAAISTASACSLYEMLAGRPPFIDPLQSALLVKQATAAPPPLPRLRQDIPRPLALAVHHLLAKRPEDRPRTAASAKMHVGAQPRSAGTNRARGRTAFLDGRSRKSCEEASCFASERRWFWL